MGKLSPIAMIIKLIHTNYNMKNDKNADIFNKFIFSLQKFQLQYEFIHFIV